MRTLLVTGASGLLGWNVCAVARDGWRTFGVVHRHPIDLPGVARLTCDLTRPDELQRLFRAVAPDALIHCAAAAQPDFCEAHPHETRPINVQVTADLADLCAAAQIPWAFVSTDLVFDGMRPPYREEDPISPINVYGEHKAAAERLARERCAAAAVCRLPPIFGDPGPGSASFLQPWIAALRDGKTLRLFTDEFRTPVGARTAAAGLLMALRVGGGTLHLGGRERVSRYDLGIILAGMLEADARLIVPARQGDRPIGAPRPPDVSLDSSRAYALGYDPPPMAEELRAVLQDLSVIG